MAAVSAFRQLVVLGLMFFSALPAFANLRGMDAIQRDLAEASGSGFSGAIGRRWIVTSDSDGCVDLIISPEGNFRVRRLRDGVNEFEVTLVRASRLLTPFGEVVSLVGTEAGCSAPSIPHRTGIAVRFLTSSRRPIALQELRRDSRVSGFSITISDTRVATVGTIGSHSVTVRRAPGHGTTPVSVTLRFTFDEEPYTYTVPVPESDDGLVSRRARVPNHRLTVTIEDAASLLGINSSTVADSESDARWELRGRLGRRIQEECTREALAEAVSRHGGPDSSEVEVANVRIESDFNSYIDYACRTFRDGGAECRVRPGRSFRVQCSATLIYSDVSRR